MHKALFLNFIMLTSALHYIEGAKLNAASLNDSKQASENYFEEFDAMIKMRCHSHDSCCRGPRGPEGATGFQGPEGASGPVGVTGSITGTTGPTGLAGIAVTENFASLRMSRNLSINAGNVIPFSINALDGDIILFNGNLSYLPSNGELITVVPGNYKITFGISSVADQAVELFIDGLPVSGSTISSPTNAQKTTQSVIAYINSTISLNAVTGVNLLQQNPGDLTAFLEVIQLDTTEQVI